MNGIEFMHNFFGSGHPSNKCGTCSHLVSVIANRKYFKCECFGNTNSEASDWRKKYPSCALYNMTYNGVAGIEIKKHMKKPKIDVQCEGQISLFDEENKNVL